MKQALYLMVFFGMFCQTSKAQSNFLISTPAEIRLIGMNNYFFTSHHSYLLYNTNDSKLQMLINLHDLVDEHSVPMQGEEIEYNSNVLDDTNNLVFTCLVEESKLRPTKPLTDTYTFSITGTARYRNVDYITMIVCSYGAKMIRNSSNSNTSVVSINVNMEIAKMDNPMYVPVIKNLIDNLKIEIIDGTVNMVQR
jgi:hypothetical protein